MRGAKRWMLAHPSLADWVPLTDWDKVPEAYQMAAEDRLLFPQAGAGDGSGGAAHRAALKWAAEELPALCGRGGGRRRAADGVEGPLAPLTFLQRAGEAVYLPPGWLHATVNVAAGTTVAVANTAMPDEPPDGGEAWAAMGTYYHPASHLAAQALSVEAPLGGAGGAPAAVAFDDPSGAALRFEAGDGAVLCSRGGAALPPAARLDWDARVGDCGGIAAAPAAAPPPRGAEEDAGFAERYRKEMAAEERDPAIDLEFDTRLREFINESESAGRALGASDRRRELFPLPAGAARRAELLRGLLRVARAAGAATNIAEGAEAFRPPRAGERDPFLAAVSRQRDAAREWGGPEVRVLQSRQRACYVLMHRLLRRA